jgi:hypothetical protein
MESNDLVLNDIKFACNIDELAELKEEGYECSEFHWDKEPKPVNASDSKMFLLVKYDCVEKGGVEEVKWDEFEVESYHPEGDGFLTVSPDVGSFLNSEVCLSNHSL